MGNDAHKDDVRPSARIGENVDCSSVRGLFSNNLNNPVQNTVCWDWEAGTLLSPGGIIFLFERLICSVIGSRTFQARARHSPSSQNRAHVLSSRWHSGILRQSGHSELRLQMLDCVASLLQLLRPRCAELQSLGPPVHACPQL